MYTDPAERDSTFCEQCEKEFEYEDYGHFNRYGLCTACHTAHLIELDGMLADNRAQRRQVAMMERDRACGRTVAGKRSHRIAQDAMGPAPLT